MFQYSSISVTLKLPNFDKPQFDENFILEVKVVHYNLNFLHSICYHPFWKYSSTNCFWVFITVTKQDSSWISSKSRVASSLTHRGGTHRGVVYWHFWPLCFISIPGLSLWLTSESLQVLVFESVYLFTMLFWKNYVSK